MFLLILLHVSDQLLNKLEVGSSYRIAFFVYKYIEKNIFIKSISNPTVYSPFSSKMMT